MSKLLVIDGYKRLYVNYFLLFWLEIQVVLIARIGAENQLLAGDTKTNKKENNTRQRSIFYSVASTYLKFANAVSN